MRGPSPTPDDRTPPTSDGAVVAALRAALGPRAGHVVVTAATAKAAEELVSQAAAEIVAYRCIWLSGRALDPVHLLRTLGAQDGSVKSLLARARGIDRPVVVVVTEADAAQASELERLRLVVECTEDAADRVRLVLLGGSKLLETLRSSAARALATRVTKVISVPAATVASPLPHTSHVMSEPMRVPARRRPPARPWRVVTAGLLGAAVTGGAGLLVIAASRWQSPPPLEANAAAAALPVTANEPEPPPPPRPHEDLPPPRAVVHPPASPPLRQQIVQVGAFRSLGNATALRDELARTFERVVVTDVKRDGVIWHRVRIEGLTSAAAVNAALTTLRRAGHRPMRVRD